MTVDTLPLFDLPALVTPDYAPALTLAERFQVFHAANPHVARALEQLAEQWFAAGRQRTGVKALFEVLRYQVGIQTSGDEYVLNNSYTAFYGRLLIERHPAWSDRIHLRTQKAAA